MVDSTRMGLTNIVFVFYMINFVTTFNIDTKNPYIYNSVKDTYFGYSLAFNKDTRSIIVGAPFSNDTNKGTKPWGSVFSCSYSDIKSQRTCNKLHKVDTLIYGAEIKNNQMMGATVYSDNYRTMACAPRYKTRSNDGNFIWIQGKCDVIYPDYTDSEDWVWRPCTTGDDNNKFGYCQSGFSGKLLQNKHMIGGCPSYTRAPTVQGLLAMFTSGPAKFTDETGLNISDYVGYSVGAGKISVGVTQSIVGGAPRANLLTGRVVIYKVISKGIPISYSITDPENQPGSYFGSALVVTNIDNDANNLDDLVVGAPYYSSGQSPNEGAVYVYLNAGGLKQKLYGDKEENACFGYSIGSVGDLNKDSYNDIVVGAPWGGPEGRGVVYVYYGSTSKNQPLIFKQKLLPSELGSNAAKLNGFGYSFAEYYPYKVQDLKSTIILNDVDGNEYPDLGIGAYRSDSVVILRSRPVVTISGTLSLVNTKKIDLFDLNPRTICKAKDGISYKCMQIRVGFTLSGTGIGADGTDVKYTLDVDYEQKVKRAFFLAQKGDVKKSTHTDVMNVKNMKRTDLLTVYLVNNTKDIVHEMVIMLKWDIKDSSSCSTSDKICPVANQMVDVSTVETLPYIKGCSSDGNDECNADLILTMTKQLPSGGETIQSGITKLIDINIQIKNQGENAFLNKLRVEYPTTIQPNKVVIEKYPGVVIWNLNTSLSENRNILEVILSNPIHQNTVEKVKIQFGVSSLTSTLKQVNLKAEVVTESIEMKPADNKARISIDVVLVANLTVTGNVYPEQVKWTKGVTSTSIPGQKITHTFLLQNRGPSGADTSHVVIKFPEKIDGQYIMNIISVNLEGSSKFGRTSGECDVGKLNPIGLNISKSAVQTSRSSNNITRSGRRRREVDEGIDCDGKNIGCRIIKCKLKNLKKSDYVSVKIISYLVDATFETFIKVNRKIGVYAKFTSKTVDKPAKDAAKDNIEVFLTVLSPHVTYTAESKPLPWWIILICVLAALLIIVIVYTILYKKKFFERKRPPTEEEGQLKNGDLDDEEE